VNWLWEQCPPERRDNKIFVPPLRTKFKSSTGVDNLYQKPVPLMEELLLRYTGKGGVVADWTAGLGSTAVACAINPELSSRAGTNIHCHDVYIELILNTHNRLPF
jgi:hypothetical protein